MITLQNLVNATACAVAVLDGTAGGYGPQEKEDAKQTMIQLKNELIAAIQQTCADPMSISVKQQLFDATVQK